ncbi:MAG: hypothetical protein H6579_07750 [Chitinophagales bacterium]|nr:hypothetical protein [Chitinophagales bacterium]
MRYLALFIFLTYYASVFAQGTYTPLNTDSYHEMDRLDIQYGKILPIPHTSVKPYNKKTIGEYAEAMYNSNIDLTGQMKFNLEYLMHDNSEWVDSFETKRRPFLKIFYPERASMLGVNTDAFILKLNPVVQTHFAPELGDKLTYNITRGFEMRAYIKKKLGFYMYLGSNLMRFPSYVREERVNREFAHVPGDAYWKEYQEGGQDYFTTRGYMTFNVIKHLDFQFGYDKNFIGNGYRSMMLSDNAAAYMFLKMNIKVWKINYQSIFAELTGQYARGTDRLLDKKYGAFHHLNFNVTKWLDLGVFEGVIITRSKHFELHYLNPLIFYRSIEQALGSPDNAMVGFDYKANVASTMQFYGQFVMDEFNFEHIRKTDGWWANKYAIQQGFKYINVGGLDNLDLQVEYNMARPFIYTHNSNQGQQLANYTHYNQELAHPLGANFREFIAIARYQPAKLPQLNLRLTYINAVHGMDTVGTLYGGDIFQQSNGNLATNEFDNWVGQGKAFRTNYIEFLASYQFFHNMYADLSVSYRNIDSDIKAQNSSSTWIGVGLRLNMPYRSMAY